MAESVEPVPSWPQLVFSRPKISPYHGIDRSLHHHHPPPTHCCSPAWMHTSALLPHSDGGSNLHFKSSVQNPPVSTGSVPVSSCHFSDPVSSHPCLASAASQPLPQAWPSPQVSDPAQGHVTGAASLAQPFHHPPLAPTLQAVLLCNSCPVSPGVQTCEHRASAGKASTTAMASADELLHSFSDWEWR